MNKAWFRAIFLMALFLAIFLFNAVDLKAHKGGYTFQSWAHSSPTIDGNIDEGEWKFAATASFYLGEGYAGTLFIMNDADDLYIAAKVSDDDFSNTDGFYINFDNDNNGVYPESGDDYLYVKLGSLIDGYLTDASDTASDTSGGGTQDGLGAMASDASFNYYEFKHPIDSADDPHDFSLASGSTVGFRIRYFDGDGTGYTVYWPGETPEEFGDIVVASLPPTLAAFASTVPAIDGNIDTSSEWASAATTQINFGWTYSGTLYVMNDEENLYIAAKISDADLTQGDILVILFDNDNNGIGWENGEDQLQLVGSDDFGDDYFQDLFLNDDVLDGGTKDGDAKASSDGSFNYYEFKHPIDSADDSHDISLSEGSTVGITFQYMDETVNYWGGWPSPSAPSWAKVTIVSGSDFSINADPTSISIGQGTSGSSTINITSIHSFSESVSLSYSWFGNAPSQITINLPGPIIPPPDGHAISELQVSAGGSATIGSFNLRVTGSSGDISHFVDVGLEITETTASTPIPTLPIPDIPMPECVIATAAYGSEISEEVQFLRSFRDNKVTKTAAGSNFMRAFNAFYYSFSPSVAQFISGSSALRLITRILIYPLIGSLYLSSLIYNPLSFAPELAVIASGFTTSLLLGVIYLFPITTIILVILKRKGHSIKGYNTGWLALTAVLALLAISIGELATLGDLIMIGSSLFVVSSLGISGLVLATEVIKRL